MATALDAARYILASQDLDEEEERITNLKLQKLLYYCQGFSLVLRGVPLFREQVVAWKHGPVVPVVYHEFKEHGFNPIPIPARRSYALKADEKKLIDEVVGVYGDYSARALRRMTHAEPPWANTEQSATITHKAMISYFKTRIK